MTDDLSMLSESLLLHAVRLTEATAIAAASHRGRGNETAAIQAASRAMRSGLDELAASARIAVGESDADEAGLGTGVSAGRGGPSVDLAVNPLEGATLCAKGLPNALAAAVIGLPGSLKVMPDVYMDKIAIGPGYPEGIVDLDASAADNMNALAHAKGVRTSDLTACVLDRPRHSGLIAALRETGAAVRLISDGDIAAVIETARADVTGLDIYLGMGGAPEGLIAAAALRCMGGQMQARLAPLNAEQRARLAETGLDPAEKYAASDLASGDLIVSATGISGGALLQGVLATSDGVRTHSLAMHGAAGAVRWISTHHRRPASAAA